MSLLVWLPLTNNFENKGLSNVTVTNTNVTIDHTDANLGGCGYFNGSARIQISLPSELTTLKNTTISAWIKCSGTTILGGISHNGSAGQNSIGCCTLYNTGWQFNKSGSWVYVGSYASNTNWKHVAVTIEDDTITTYMNGSVTATSSLSSQTLFSDLGTGNFIEIGSDFPGGDEYLTGRICDFRVYDHALSKREIKELSKGLTIHLPMNWGTGKPNMIKNSYTWMNKNAGSHWVSTGAITKAVLEDDTAPCKWVYKVTKNNSEGTSSANGGAFYGYSAQGVELTDLVEGETYTYSFWAKADTSNDTSFNLQAGSVCESQTLVSSTGFTNLDSNWRKHTVTFKWTKTTKLTACLYCTTPAGKTQIFYCCGLKLEKGDTATPYIPHVSETAYTEKGFGVNYKDECSGYNRGINSGGTAVIGEESPRGTGTYCTSGCYLQATSGFPLSSAMPSWTIALWFKPDIGKTFTSWSDVFRFWMNTETGNNTHFRLETQNSSGNNYCLYYNNSGASSYGGGALTTITENKWYHLAFCCDSTKIYQYINSELKITHTINTGYKPTGPTGYFQIGDGGMYASYADVRVYATCLSADDIKELYQIPVQIDKTGKVYCNNLVEA